MRGGSLGVALAVIAAGAASVVSAAGAASAGTAQAVDCWTLNDRDRERHAARCADPFAPALADREAAIPTVVPSRKPPPPPPRLAARPAPRAAPSDLDLFFRNLGRDLDAVGRLFGRTLSQR